jgi:dihydropyrimidine dehydrogenase (NAD+) subunit PreA
MSLDCEWLGIKMKSPLIIGAGQHTTTGSNLGKWVDEIADNHWGGVVTKTYFPGSDVYSVPYLWSPKHYYGTAMQNCGPNLEQFSDAEAKRLTKSIKKAHEREIVVAVSIMASSIEEWQYLATNAEKCGADIVELNLSCPAAINSIQNNKMGGYQASKEAEVVYEVVKAVTDVLNIPVSAKLTPNTSDITITAKACIDGGAKGITAINTVQGIIGVDVETGIPYCSDVLGTAFKTGISGPAIKPIGLRLVTDLAQEFPNLPISGVGGISVWKDAVEYIMLGAQNVQVCTAVMQNGFKLGTKLYNGIRSFMKDKNYESVSDFRGLALNRIDTVSKKCPRSAAYIDKEICVGCGKCYTACHYSAFDAIHKTDDGKYEVDQKTCAACGLCNVVCAKKAVSVSPIKK